MCAMQDLHGDRIGIVDGLEIINAPAQISTMTGGSRVISQRILAESEVHYSAGHSHLQAPPLRSGASAAVRPFVTSPWQSVIEDSSQLPQLVRPAGMGSFHPPAGGSFQPAATGGSQGEGAAGMRYQGLISTPPTASAGW